MKTKNNFNSSKKLTKSKAFLWSIYCFGIAFILVYKNIHVWGQDWSIFIFLICGMYFLFFGLFKKSK